MKNPGHFDKEETLIQLEEITTLINNLRPEPTAALISREKLALMAALSGLPKHIEFATSADENTLFWEINGDIVKQVVVRRELRLV